MKPTVISGGGASNANAPNTTNNNNSNIDPHSNNENIGGSSRQQFPHFQGFDVDPDIDDMFSDTGIRSRLDRMPFGFGSRKRCNDPNRYFDDDNDFFSNFGSLGRRRQQPQTTDRQGIFDHIPAEFRQYMPDTFDFPSTTRTSVPQSPRSAGTQQQYSPQYYETYAQPGPASPTATQPQPQKPKLCDAAIQTENLTEEADQGTKTHKTQPLKQHGLRNTVDLGQKSPSENESSPRASSAPPNDLPNQNIGSSSISTSTHDPNTSHASATAYVYIPPRDEHESRPQQRWQSQQTGPQHSQQKPPAPRPPQRAQHPQSQPQPQAQYYQGTTQTQPQSDAQQQSGTYVRTVPIFVEGRSEPVINEQKHASFESQPSQQQYQQPPQNQPFQKQYYAQQQQPPHSQSHQQQTQYQPFDQYQAQQQQQPQTHTQPRPTPLNTQQANSAAPPNQASPVPQTPHTTETIEKIQSIQRDVLDLMTKVEKFTGMKNDKEYMYLDEMLTRNLLKLDTIDTQGKERIRLARKEAIKCIQASINVLEAIAEGNAKTAQKSVIGNQENKEISNESQKAADGENQYQELSPMLDETNTGKLPDVVPLPPPPERPIKQNSQEQENKEANAVAQPEQTNQENESQSETNTVKDASSKPIELEQEEKHKTSEATSEEKEKGDIAPAEVSKEPEATAEEQQKLEKEERQSSPTKENKSKDLPKKKIVKKIVKKLEKKDKKGTGSPPSSESGTETVGSAAESSTPIEPTA